MAGGATEHGWIRHGRARLNLAMRLTTRSHELISAGGVIKGRTRLAVAAASTAADLALVRRLRRSDRPELAFHWLVDAADLAIWTALSTRAGYSQLTTAMNNGHALAIEAGARHGVWGLAVPVANCVVSGVVQKVRRRPHVAGTFAWQVAAALAGAGLARYARGIRRRRLADHEARLGPELSRAELSAENELALGLDNIFDEAQRAAVLIQLSVDAPGNVTGAWKAELAEQTRRSHRYLVDALAVWQRRHNQTPQLVDVVALDVAAELAPVVLSADAASALEAQLDQLPLRGRLRVVKAATTDGDSVAHVAVLVGEHRLDIETGVTPIRLSFDALPGGFGWMALWLAVARLRDAVPRREALVPAAGAVGLMLWANRSNRVGTPVPRAAAVDAATVLALVGSVVQTRAMPNPHDPYGLPRVPASLSLRGLAFVTALSLDGLPRRALFTAWGGGLAAIVAAWALTPPPRPVREFAAELSWVAMSATMAAAFTDGIAHESADLEAWVVADDRRRLAASTETGRRKALAVVEQAVADAERLYVTHADELDEDLCVEIRSRLDGCTERLATMG